MPETVHCDFSVQCFGSQCNAYSESEDPDTRISKGIFEGAQCLAF